MRRPLRAEGVRATAAGPDRPHRRSATRAGGPALGHDGLGDPLGPSSPRISSARWRRRRVSAGPAVTKRPCGPLCNRACIAGLWPGSRSGVMKQPWSIGFKIPTNRHPGRRPILACNEMAGVRGSVTQRKPSAGSRSASHRRAQEWRSNDRWLSAAGGSSGLPSRNGQSSPYVSAY